MASRRRGSRGTVHGHRERRHDADRSGARVEGAGAVGGGGPGRLRGRGREREERRRSLADRPVGRGDSHAPAQPHARRDPGPGDAGASANADPGAHANCGARRGERGVRAGHPTHPDHRLPRLPRAVRHLLRHDGLRRRGQRELVPRPRHAIGRIHVQPPERRQGRQVGPDPQLGRGERRRPEPLPRLPHGRARRGGGSGLRSPPAGGRGGV